MSAWPPLALMAGLASLAVPVPGQAQQAAATDVVVIIPTEYPAFDDSRGLAALPRPEGVPAEAEPRPLSALILLNPPRSDAPQILLNPRHANARLLAEMLHEVRRRLLKDPGGPDIVFRDARVDQMRRDVRIDPEVMDLSAREFGLLISQDERRISGVRGEGRMVVIRDFLR